MKYLILIHHNPTTTAMWESFSAEQQAEGWQAYAAIQAELVASGELIATEALADPSEGKRIEARGHDYSSDGPFAEAKEHLAGFFLVECESMERAVEVAERIPEAEMGLVEVRPVLQLGAADA